MVKYCIYFVRFCDKNIFSTKRLYINTTNSLSICNPKPIISTLFNRKNKVDYALLHF